MVVACGLWHGANGMRLIAILMDRAHGAGKFRREDNRYDEG